MGYSGYQLNLWRWHSPKSTQVSRNSSFSSDILIVLRQTTRHEISFDLVQKSTSLHAQTSPESSVSLPVHCQLPPEVVLDILHFAEYDDCRQPDRKTLLACSLVSRTWRGLAQKLLFRHAIIDSERAYHSFWGAISASSTLAQSVLSIDATTDFAQPKGMDYDHMADAVSRCPRLVELSVSVYGRCNSGPRVAPSFQPSTLQRLRDGPRITSLRFDNWSDSRFLLQELLSAFPSVRSLSLAGTAPEFCINTNTEHPYTARPLEELRLNIAKTASVLWFDSLVDVKAPLRTLEFVRDPDLCVLEHVVSRHSGTIQSLRLPRCGYAESQIILGCSTLHLRELSVEGPSIRVAVLDDVLKRTDAKATELDEESGLSSVGLGLEHLAIGVGRETPLSRIIQRLRSTCLPGQDTKRSVLRKLTLLIRPDGDDHPLLGWLTEICKEQDIVMRCTNDPKIFRSLMVHGTLGSHVYPNH
jgi:hypothetical protein